MKLGSRLAIIFMLMALVLIGSVAATYWMGLVTVRSEQSVARRRAVIGSLNDTLSTLKDAETGQRGYLLTNDEAYLTPYLAAVQKINAQLKVLQSEAQAGDLAMDDVQGIVNDTHVKLDELAQTISLHQSRQQDSALQIVHLGLGHRTMESIRDRAAAMIVRQEENLLADAETANRLTIIRTALFAVVAVFNLLFLYWAFLRVREEMAARESAAAEVGRQKELLAVTLASIGDGVIIADTSGRIVFLNEVAEKLTGWAAGEACGELCSKIFQIINEDSRLPVESPVDKVLTMGVIVGLANHTLLIRKDESEIPIDDSGAPIRDPEGTLRGVVLVFRDFSEHKAAENALRAAKSDLEAASKAKDQFLATLSHELRTPLTPVLATLTTWEASDELPAAFRDDVQMLRRNIALEARLIDDLLDLTRIVRGKLPLEFEIVDVHELIRSVAGMYRSEINAKRVEMAISLNARQHHANADPGRLQQVFWNILKNATKFTASGGRIDIFTADGTNGTLQIIIRDTGIGMSDQMLRRLFLPFEQGAEETVRRAGGLGLGMAISKALIEVQGGTITAASEGSGKGSIFTVTIPSVAAPERSTETNGERDRKSHPQSRLLSILLVEDHADTARVMGRLLRRLGHTVEMSDSVAGALQLVHAGDFDVLLSDIGLPDGTGLELIRRIRETKDMPAIALTGFGMDEDIAKCKEAGFTAHLTKPVNFQRLEMVIQQVAMAKVEA